jgi:hypothetical protein
VSDPGLYCPGGGTRIGAKQTWIDAEHLSPVLNLEQVDVEKLITAEVDDGNEATKPVTAWGSLKGCNGLTDTNCLPTSCQFADLPAYAFDRCSRRTERPVQKRNHVRLPLLRVGLERTGVIRARHGPH